MGWWGSNAHSDEAVNASRGRPPTTMADVHTTTTRSTGQGLLPGGSRGVWGRITVPNQTRSTSFYFFLRRPLPCRFECVGQCFYIGDAGRVARNNYVQSTWRACRREKSGTKYWRESRRVGGMCSTDEQRCTTYMSKQRNLPEMSKTKKRKARVAEDECRTQ